MVASRYRRIAFRAVIIVVPVLLITAAGGAWWLYVQMRASLPLVEGSRRLEGLSGPVTVARDALGIPVIRGASRVDVARATGFVHAQDRFFQMDLARRRAAGEVAALVGARGIPLDLDVRLHRFRSVAARALALLRPDDRALLDAYTAGVNAGLNALGAVPFEYLLLREKPGAWRAEDSLLVVLSMFVTLQDTSGSYEATRATIHDLLPPEMSAFLSPRGTEWDTPLIGAAFQMPAIPPAAVYDARTRRRGRPPVTRTPSREEASRDREAMAIGSNNWAVAGTLTGDGGALVANDMHLAIRVPNTWYRAALEWPFDVAQGGPAAGSNDMNRLIGVTLPGVPSLVVGSNTHVAWGFTNSYGDWGDIVLLETNPANPDQYRTPDGWRRFEAHIETIEVAGATALTETVTSTIWGPVIEPDHRGRPRAFQWVAHSPDMLASSLTPVESARTLEEAFAEANGAGTPAQNFVAADRSGRIGWTIYGSIPRRVGFDGSLPASRADGTRGWHGWLDDSEFPRIIDPPLGRLWTANARVVDGDMLEKIGDGSYEVGSRARMIRERLLASDRFSPQDLLDIQLDARATFLERWRELMLSALSPSALAGNRVRQHVRRVLEEEWTGRASPESGAYALARTFRDRVSDRVFNFVLADCYESDEDFDYSRERKREGPLWRLVTEKPRHLLDLSYDSWDTLLVAAVDDVADEALSGGMFGAPSARRWSELNAVEYKHPITLTTPILSRWLDMPKHDLPGDLYTPRMAWGAVGASERMVVSPGREAEGIMHMPTGQSGHPLSPHYADSHDAWVRGEPTPFLPGPAAHTLTLTP